MLASSVLPADVVCPTGTAAGGQASRDQKVFVSCCLSSLRFWEHTCKKNKLGRERASRKSLAGTQVCF